MAMKKEHKEKCLSSRERFALEQLFYRLAMTTIDICFHIVAGRKGNKRLPLSFILKHLKQTIACLYH